MKIGDVVRIRNNNTLGVLMSEGKKYFMVGILVEVLVDGTVKKVLKDDVEVIVKKQAHSKND